MTGRSAEELWVLAGIRAVQTSFGAHPTPTEWVLVALPSGINPVPDDHSHPSSAKVKNEWS